MEIFNYFAFVIVPIFLLGFQALLLPVFFFLKSRNWLQNYAFAVAGALTGIGFGYVFAAVSGLQQSAAALAMASVCAFGALSGLFWWYLLVKRLENDGDVS